MSTDDKIPQHVLRAILEALLLAAEEPVTVDRLTDAIEGTTPQEVSGALKTLELEYAGHARGIHLCRIANGFQLRTNPSLGNYLRAFFESRPLRLSRAAMETLAIIAYRQPITRAGVEDVRGVNCSGVLATLREYDLVDIIGRLDDIGKPHLYGTTERFLEFFGLPDLSELPVLEQSELEALVEMHADSPLPDEQEPASEPDQHPPHEDESP